MLPYSRLLDDSELDKLVGRAKDFNAAGTSMIEEGRPYQMMRQVVSMPPGVRKTALQIRCAFDFDMTQRLAAAIIKNFPWLEATADDITQEAERRASKKERHTIGALKRAAMEAGTHQDPFARGTWAQVGDGMGVDKWLFRPDRWYPWPGRNGSSPSQYQKTIRNWKMAHYPFMWRSIDPLCYYPLYGDEGKVFVAEITQRAIADLNYAFGEEKVRSAVDLLEAGVEGSQGGSRISGTIEFQELWTLGHTYYRVRGKTVHTVPHGLPFIPYYESRGITTQINVPGSDALPLTYALRKYIPWLDTMFTIIAEAFLIGGIPTPFLKTDSNAPEYARLFGPDGRPITWPIAIGQINPVMGELSMPLSQAMPSQLADAVKVMTSLADSVNLPPALRGQGIGSDWSGYLANTVLHVVMTMLAPAMRSREMAMGQMIRDYWWTIQHKVGQDVWVWAYQKSGRGKWAELGPDDIQDFYECQIHMRPSLPRDEAQRAQTGASLCQQGLISTRTFLTDWLEMDFPDEEEERIMLERLFKSPEVDQVRLIALMQRLAPESPVVAKILESLAPPALPPGGGMPGAVPGMQEAAPFAPGAIGGGLPGGEGAVPYVGGRPSSAGMATAVPGGPRMAP